jgi:hypothetical protein
MRPFTWIERRREQLGYRAAYRRLGADHLGSPDVQPFRNAVDEPRRSLV